MGAGKIVAIVGGILGILTITLYYVLPEIFCLWRIDGAPILSGFLGGFGSVTGETGGVGFGPDYAEDIWLTIPCILIIAGGALAVVGGLAEIKIVGILGGVLMLAGPILLVVAIALELGDFEFLAALLGGESLFFGSQPGVDWGLYIGFFLAIGGGVLGLIGGIKVED